MLKSKSEIEGFKSRLKQYRQAKSEDSQLNYWDYMTKLSSKKAKDWQENEDITLTQMLNDNTYNYKEFYDKDKEQAMKMLTADSEAHFTDVGKTVYHPTFSNESSYSGKVSEFNPRGTVGGSWKGEDYYVSPSQIQNNDYNYSKTRDYLNKAGGKDGKIFIPKYADGTEGIEDKYNFISKPPKDINTNSKAFNDWSLLAATQALQRSRSSNSPSGSKYTVKQKPNISEYLPFIWSEENSIKKGYDKNQDKWFPHNSVEGGQKTIGPGIKLNEGSYKPSNKEANKGMTEDQLNSYATQLFNYNLKRVDEYLGDYNDTISPQIKMGLADIRYQVGSLANFSKLKQAIKKGDIKKIQKESKVHIEGLGQDKRRNELRKQKYFHY